jgi:hypothetical protein
MLGGDVDQEVTDGSGTGRQISLAVAGAAVDAAGLGGFENLHHFGIDQQREPLDGGSGNSGPCRS